MLADHFHEALFARQNLTIDMGRLESRYFLLYGWSQVEQDDQGRSFIWADHTESAVLFPLKRSVPLSIVFEACPFMHEELASQVLIVKMNNRRVAVQTMGPDWRFYRVSIPREIIQSGNNILSFQFSRTTSPRELGLGQDIRKLAASFRSIRYSVSEESASPVLGRSSDMMTVYEADISGRAEKVIVIPATGSLTFQTVIPDRAYLRTAIGIRTDYETWDRAIKESLIRSPITFRIIQIGPSGKEQMLYERTFPKSRRDREYLEKHSSEYLVIRDRGVASMMLSLEHGGSLCRLKLETFREHVDGHIPVQSVFISSTVMGVWKSPPFERIVQDAVIGKTKIFLLGLDGLTWDILLPMIDRGELPNLAGLVESGFSSRLETLLPSKSPMLWTSVATGKVSDKHGIVDYVSWDPEKKSRIPVTVNLRKTKALWNIFSDLGKISTVIGWWPSWPAEEIEGFMVSDRRGGSTIPNQTYPSNLWDELQEKCRPEQFDYSRFLPAPPDLVNRMMGPVTMSIPEAKAIEHQLMRVQQKDSYFFRCADYLLEKVDTDLFALYLNGADPVCHLFWKYLHPEQYGLSRSEAEPFSDIIPGYYRYLDEIVGRLMLHAGPDTTLFIISDHGFGSEFNRNFKVKVNKLMELLGMYVRDEKTGKPDYSRTFVERGPSIDASLDQRMVFGPAIRNNTAQQALVREKLEKTVNSIVSVETGQKPFRLDWEPGEDYDFTIEVDYRSILDEDLLINGVQVPFSTIFPEDFVSGSHGWGPDGIFIASGPFIRRLSPARMNMYERRNRVLRKPSILDITPTILFAMGFPVGEDMDGRPYFGVFTDEYIRKRTLSKIPSYDKVGEPLRFDQKAIESKQDDSIRNQLRSLGYIN